MKYSLIDVKPISGALGAEIHGLDIGKELSNEEMKKEVRRAFLEHGVIFFRDQNLTPEQHIYFGKWFGPLNRHPVLAPLEGYPDILVIAKEKEELTNIGNAWHSDVTFLERPALGSILYAREVPPFGGDTMFANMYLAYEQLSDGMRGLLDSLVAIHSGARAYGTKETVTERFDAKNKGMKAIVSDALEAFCEHPVVRTHPETGRKALFVNRGFTTHFKGMTRKESKPILEFLYEHAAMPEFTCRFRWEKNSIAFWDNRCVHHYAINDYHGHQRLMHRVTIEGDRPY